MPELPEVEVIRRGLLPHLCGRKIISVTTSGKKLRKELPLDDLQSFLQQATIHTITRRAKYLLITTTKENNSSSATQDIVIIHLGMTGQLGIFPKRTLPRKHDHLFILLDNDFELRYNDTRRFGFIEFRVDTTLDKLEKNYFTGCGPEPFDPVCSGGYLKNKARKRTQPIKNFIMDGSVLVGVGNIYANESLFAAGIHPKTKACDISTATYDLLISKIREILNWAIDCGGSTISDFIDASGNSGYFQVNFKVYGRAGKPCVTCGTPVTKEVIGGRASFYCEVCQKRIE